MKINTTSSFRSPLSLLLLLPLLLLLHVDAERIDYLQAVENPHIPQDAQSADGQCASCSSCPAKGFLDPTTILNELVATQPDTLINIHRKNYMGVEVPIYHFKQPDRLNPQQLPFKLIRTRTINPEGLLIIPVDAAAASDSWFPDYQWDILVCSSCDGYQHLGWRFTPKLAGAGETFYALIVDYNESRRRSAEAERDLLEGLKVGTRAPAWLIALATATLQAQMRSK
mmetsp:Transcript_1850/g.5601  ORF Transcript_1850/g.5601 Transcript_1850/m.5601 type:complete len:227 (-) Transcript_1850:203-883(-)